MGLGPASLGFVLEGLREVFKFLKRNNGIGVGKKREGGF